MAKRRIQELEEPGNHRGGQDQLLDSERLEDGSHVRSVVEGMTVNDRHENAKHFPDKLLSKGAKLHKAAKHGTKFSQFAKRHIAWRRTHYRPNARTSWSRQAKAGPDCAS